MRPKTSGRAATAPLEEPRSCCGPLVIVGQARSGTSLLTRLLADTRRFALINDAYLIQYLDALSAREELDLHQRQKFAEFVLEQIRTRVVSPDAGQMYRSVYLTPEQLHRLEVRAGRFVEECETGWDLIATLLSATAELSGCDVWGWKCPPDYMHLDRVLARFPQARIVFLIRNPFKMMRSYKNWPWRDGRSRYHPLVQAIVWRSVVQRFHESGIDNDSRILLIRFEDVLDQTADLRARLTGFFGEFDWPETVKKVPPNTSMRHSGKELTWIEWSICKLVTRPYLQRFNYDADRAKKEGIGVLDLLCASVRCACYYAILALRSRDMRNRLKLYMAALR